MTVYYKVTNLDGAAYHDGHGRWTLGRWRSVRGPLVACQRGLHLCTADQLVDWLGPVIWKAEASGEVLYAGDKMVTRRARIVCRVETWNERTARLFAADCAERVLPLFEAQYPTDDRPRKVIEVARRFANGEATEKELAAAEAAEAATRDAAVTAGVAAGAAAWAAVAAGVAGAAEAAEAARAARAAARAAEAAGAADRAAAWDAERKWQTERLMEILGERA